MTILLDPQLVLMVFGALIGGQVVLALLSLLVGAAYQERSLFALSAAIAVSIGSILAARLAEPPFASAALVLLVALSVLHLKQLTLHVGALRGKRQLMTGFALGLAALACVTPLLPASEKILAATLIGWLAWLVYVLIRAWGESQPWVVWAAAGWAALTIACAARILDLATSEGLATPLALSFWAVGIYLASVWRSRVFGERRSRAEGEHLRDPLTGLAKRMVLAQRLEIARQLMARFHHPVTFVLVHVDDGARIAEHFGPEVAENAVLEAGSRIRQTLGQADIGARVGQHRFAVLSEGNSASEAAAAVATRIVAAGLREPMRALPDVVVRLRVILGELPLDDTSLETLIERLGHRMDEDVARRRERRIRVIDIESLGPPTTVDTSAPHSRIVRAG